MFETNGIKTNNNLVKNELLNAFLKVEKIEKKHLHGEIFND